jgi:ABC-type transport system involved in multi-copper enzyme maturation permease subunit
MKTGTTITILGISALILYGIIQLLSFYGANPSQYGIYLTFYLFLLLSVFVLPNKEPTV